MFLLFVIQKKKNYKIKLYEFVMMEGWEKTENNGKIYSFKIIKKI